MSDQHVEFVLSPQAAATLAKSLSRFRGDLPRWYYALQICLLVLQGVFLSLNVVDRPHSFWASVALTAAFVLLPLLLMGWWLRTCRHLPARGVIDVTEHGLSGMLDGRPVNIPWPTVSTVRSDGSNVMLIYGKESLAVAIPIAAFVDFAAFWKLADDRLVAKRGLIRSAQLRTLIVNTHGAHAN